MNAFPLSDSLHRLGVSLICNTKSNGNRMKIDTEEIGVTGGGKEYFSTHFVLL